MKNSAFYSLSENTRYRLMVFSRSFLAIFGGFFIASLTVPLVAFLFPTKLALATHTGLLLSFISWLAVIMWVFSIKSAIRAWIYIVSILVSMFLIIQLLKWWGAT